MNPHQKNKVDISSLNEEEQKLFRLYGKLPNRNDLLQNKLKERKYFDSGDYALSKAGKASDVGVTSIGSQHPLPENIPHLSSPSPGNSGNGAGGVGNGHGQQSSGQSGSPVKESSFLHREQSIDDQDPVPDQTGEAAISPPPQKEGVPIRWQH
ncbi:hypothetical protein MMC19_007550 [Ptychographa xylographoides]|nr:hypothetical protein [Ptychographa xylographoides]